MLYQSLKRMKLYKVAFSKINNKGLFAKKDIKKGTKIIDYIGKIITKKETENNPKFDNSRAIYLYNLNNDSYIITIVLIFINIVFVLMHYSYF